MMTPPPKWLNSTLTTHSGTLAEIRRYIPSFERRPFELGQTHGRHQRANGRLDTVVRMPLNDDLDCIPVGVVSRDYALVPHTGVLDAVTEALEAAGIDPATVEAELRLTEYGERMALSIRLPDNFYMFDPGDEFPMTVRLECLNSVDGSTRFRAVMGWFRLVCSNGLTIGITHSEADRRHVGDLQLEHIARVLRDGMTDYEVERDNLAQWRTSEVSMNTLGAWADTALRRSWGFKATARAFHIARSGSDVDVLGPYKGHTPTNIPVARDEAVPGAPAQSSNMFDVSQVLAWLAKERRDVQEQMEWREQIPALMASLTSA